MDKAAPVLSLAAATTPAATDIVVGTLLEEHRSMRFVLRACERVLRDAHEFGTPPDFALIASAFYYMDDFPERVHHPKEDDYLFAALRRRTARFNALLDRLQGEHIRASRLLSLLERELVHYQGGAPQGLKRVRAGLDAYANMLEEHMKLEELLLQSARSVLTQQDWSAIAVQFQLEADPLAARPTRREFRLLRTRIVNLLPRKIRTSADRETAEAPATVDEAL